ncbi:hypothetical protein CRG98_017514 [Punica granatum]|uniref:Uncharacterized protein n=1 Tax=Punica granatum TaxID=22663 RepID=A0A2I0K0Q0_PUNGR|nr:hypothetical protein CRG98_017514 [Punica granatum]
MEPGGRGGGRGHNHNNNRGGKWNQGGGRGSDRFNGNGSGRGQSYDRGNASRGFNIGGRGVLLKLFMAVDNRANSHTRTISQEGFSSAALLKDLSIPSFGDLASASWANKLVDFGSSQV